MDEKDVGKEIDAQVKLRVNRVSKSISTNAGEKPKKNEDYDFDVMEISFDKKVLTDELDRQMSGEAKDGGK